MKSKNESRSEYRRLEARRQRDELRETLWQRTTRWISPSALLIWVGFYVASLSIILWGSDSMPWRLGQRIDQDITARVAFEVENRAETDRDKQQARDLTPDVYELNTQLMGKGSTSPIRARLDQLLVSSQAKPGELTDGFAKLDPAVQEELRKFAADDAGRSRFAVLVKTLFVKLEDRFIASPPGESLRGSLRTPFSILRRDHSERQVISDQLIPVTNRPAVEQALQEVSAEVFPKPLQAAVSEILVQTILGAKGEKGHATPFWNFDGISTRHLMDVRVAEVPVRKTSFKTGDTLVHADKSGVILKDENLLLLSREHDSFLQAQKTDSVLRRQLLLTELGSAGLILLVTLALLMYTLVYQREIFYRPTRALGVVCLLLVMTFLSRLNERAQYPYDLPVEFAVAFVITAAALLTIAYDQRLALGVAGGLSILATLASRGDFGLFVTFLAATGVVIYSLKEIRTRSKLIIVGFLAGAASFVASGSTGLIAGQDVQYVLVHALAAAAAAIAAGFFVQGILPQFERMFGVATSMTLLEWCDASRPLLRRLAQEASGTYSHSLVLSQMAEEAANAIGANGLLARVGALYHDIGKITKAEYFVENQEARMNRHERLSPTMSLLIIVGHVKDGIEMARAYGLPRVLHQFIAEHHGTTVVKYFHRAANEMAARKHDREIPDTEFRYPGPKPSSKETAILMLCDGCEGSVRALSEPTPGRIEGSVHQVLMDRLTDGQFDECDITLRELHVVEQSLVKNLAAIHHSRVKYPKAFGEEPTPALAITSRPEEVVRQA